MYNIVISAKGKIYLQNRSYFHYLRMSQVSCLEKHQNSFVIKSVDFAAELPEICLHHSAFAARRGQVDHISIATPILQIDSKRNKTPRICVLCGGLIPL